VNGLGRAILKHRLIWLTTVVVVTVLLTLPLLVGTLSTEEDETTWYPSGDPVLEAYDAFEKRFESDEFIVIAYDWVDPFSASDLSYLEELTIRLEGAVPYVTEAVSLATIDDILGTETALVVRPLVDLDAPIDVEALRGRIDINPFLEGHLISEDEKTVAVVLEIDRPQNRVFEETSAEILAGLEGVLLKETQKTGLRFHSGGSALTEREVERGLNRDILIFFPLGLILTGALLLAFFRHIPSVLLPLATVVASLGWTLGLKALTGSPITPVSTTLFALITVIGVASSVHLISQYWTEREKNLSRKETLLETYRRAGKPCFFTALTTAVGFGSLAVSHIPAIRHLGLFAAFGIMTSFLLAMVIVPMGMDWTSHRRTRLPRNVGLEGFLSRVGDLDLRRPGLIIGLTVLVIAGMSVGIFFIEPKGSMVDYFRRGSGVRESIDFLDERMSGISSTEVLLFGSRDAFRDPANLQAMDDLARLAEEHPGVTVGYSFVDTVKLLNRAFHEEDEAFFAVPASAREVVGLVSLYESAGGGSLRDFVSGDYATARVSLRTRQMDAGERHELLDTIEAFAEERFAHLDVQVTGMDLLISGVNDQIILTQIRSFGLAVLVITAMMILVFGWRAGLLSIVPNVLPIVFVLGLMGYAGFGLNIATSIIASIAIGIVVDDTIHFFSHFRDELKTTGDRKHAVREALRKVGKALVFTTSILAAGFVVFLFANLGILASYGILSGTAVIAALAGDLFIGPVLVTRFSAFPRLLLEEPRKRRQEKA